MNCSIERNYVLLHDNNGLFEDVHSALESSGQVKTLNGYQLPEDTEENSVWVVVSALREHKWLSVVQQEARRRKNDLLFIGLESDRVWLGPFVDMQEAGCIDCMQSLAQKNNKEPYHWSNLPCSKEERRDTLPAALSFSQRAIFRHKLSNLCDVIAETNGIGLHKKSVTLDLLRMRSSEHSFISVPGCATCDNLHDTSKQQACFSLRPQMKVGNGQSRVGNPALTLKSLKKAFLDRHVGLIRHVSYSLSSNMMPMFSAEMPILKTNATEIGYGRSDTKNSSEMVAILEALERHAAHSPKNYKSAVRGNYHSLAENALNPEDLILHTPEQTKEAEFRLAPYSDSLEYNWTWCYSIADERPILVPEQSIYFYLLNDKENVNRFVYETSSGCALGGAKEEAIFYGLLESVERDAYMTTWYGRFTPKEIDLRSIKDKRIESLIHRVKASGLSIYAFDIRVGIDVPIVWCMIVDESDTAPVKSYCAAGAHLIPENAIYSAMVEVISAMGIYQKSLPEQVNKAKGMYSDHSKVTEMHDHVLLYSLPQTYEQLSFLFSSQPANTLEELYGENYQDNFSDNLTEDLEKLVSKVKVYAKDIIVADLTFKELQPHNLHCVKVLTPGLMPVTFGHQYRRVSLDRVNQFAVSEGKKAFSSVNELNQFPHNFP